MMKWMKRKPMLASAAMMIALTGCSFGGGNDAKDEQQTLRVMFYEEQSFYQQYGMLFSALYPNVNIEVVSTQSIRSENGQEEYNKLLDAFIEKEQPDIILLDPERYSRSAAEGKLAELDSLIEKDKYETEGLVPGMLDFLKEMGGGKIYGLAGDFSSQALYYNKDLFDKYGIEYPKDKMSYTDLIQLAKRFPTDGEGEERVYGLKFGYSNNLFDMAVQMGSIQNMSYVNPSKMEMTINTAGWKTTVETALDAINSKALYVEDPQNMMGGGSYEEYLLSNPFLSGKVAMMTEGPYIMQQIKQAKNFLKEDQQSKLVSNWDLVTAPVDPANPEYSSMVKFYNIFAINSKAANKDAAWSFLKYITGDEYARVTSKSYGFGNFPARVKYLDNPDNRNFAAFYTLKPSTFNMYKDYDKLPENFQMEFMGAAQMELDKVKSGGATIDEALSQLQTVGQGMLDKGKSEQAGKKEEPAADSQAAGTAEGTATGTQ
ncbi:ABC transporter substrate-binding protein [Paenibacillus sp. NEAU-GSW1]|uniref:ABC transporter substrate-binding protein n=1 Tax=Paenibacillus sp. NEAU-GSW1 TaxID=2682486 RepID=UPI0012E2493F|nr:extracellular solute-binding protein [Paenibacillus sp. NEAU-GSW1]MUT68522.1 extracellular solute-binding protein [Paenibacillus sp. NEAU-GSW1]